MKDQVVSERKFQPVDRRELGEGQDGRRWSGRQTARNLVPRWSSFDAGPREGLEDRKAGLVVGKEPEVAEQAVGFLPKE